MSNAGRLPVPSWIKELRGTLQPGDRAGEPQPEAAIYVPPPRELADQALASEFWEVHLPLLVRNKMITEVDMTAFVVCCLAYQSWIQAEQQLAKPVDQGGGHTILTKNGYPVQSPWVSIAQARQKHFVEMIREFGLTPSSRTRIKIQLIGSTIPGGKGGADEHQEYFDF